MAVASRFKLWSITAVAAIGGGVLGYGLGQPDKPNVSDIPATTAQSETVQLSRFDDNRSLRVANAGAEQTPNKQIESATLDVPAAIKAIVAQPTQFEQFAAAYPVANAADEFQLQQLIETLLAMEQSDSASIGIARIFYVRFINLNPGAAAAHFWANVPESSVQYRRVMFNIYHEWAWFDMPAALADITEVVDEKHREDIITFLLRDDHFTQSRPLAELAATFSELTRAEAMLASVSRQSNEAAFEQLMSMPRNSDARRHGLFRLVRRWAQEDPQGALARLKLLNHSTDRHNLITNVISIWAQTDAEQALIAAINIDDGNNYAYAALSTLAKVDGIKALELTRQYQDKLETTVQSQVMQTWASSDPKGAAAYIEQQGGPGLLKNARQIAWHYTLQHPEDAYRWAERIGLLDDNNLASHMGNALVQSDLSKAQEIFASLPPSASRDGLFTSIVRQRSKIDIAQTYRWLAEHSEQPKFMEARNNLLYEWSRRDPQGASERILSLDNNPNQSGHLASVATNWYDRSPEQALRWLYDLPYGSLRDRTIASLAHKVGRSDVDEAIRIASQIGDEQFRNNLLEQLRTRKR